MGSSPSLIDAHGVLSKLKIISNTETHALQEAKCFSAACYRIVSADRFDVVDRSLRPRLKTVGVSIIPLAPAAVDSGRAVHASIIKLVVARCEPVLSRDSAAHERVVFPEPVSRGRTLW
jgi:hypothetical protein